MPYCTLFHLAVSGRAHLWSGQGGDGMKAKIFDAVKNHVRVPNCAQNRQVENHITFSDAIEIPEQTKFIIQSSQIWGFCLDHCIERGISFWWIFDTVHVSEGFDLSTESKQAPSVAKWRANHTWCPRLGMVEMSPFTIIHTSSFSSLLLSHCGTLMLWLSWTRARIPQRLWCWCSSLNECLLDSAFEIMLNYNLYRWRFHNVFCDFFVRSCSRIPTDSSKFQPTVGRVLW